jgi:hypothetical protein
VATDPEALTQLARLLDDASLRNAPPDAVRDAVDNGMPRLVDALMAEATASDDVIDRDSALEFLQRRLDFLSGLLTAQQASRLLSALSAKIESW